jgi:hypothetical protein
MYLTYTVMSSNIACAEDIQPSIFYPLPSTVKKSKSQNFKCKMYVTYTVMSSNTAYSEDN